VWQSGKLLRKLLIALEPAVTSLNTHELLCVGSVFLLESHEPAGCDAANL
jgi:hypothetical protein